MNEIIASYIPTTNSYSKTDKKLIACQGALRTIDLDGEQWTCTVPSERQPQPSKTALPPIPHRRFRSRKWWKQLISKMILEQRLSNLLITGHHGWRKDPAKETGWVPFHCSRILSLAVWVWWRLCVAWYGKLLQESCFMVRT